LIVAAEVRPRGRQSAQVRGNSAVLRARRLLSEVWLFVLPGLAIYGLFVLYPAAKSFWYSLTSWSGLGAQHFIGFKNYEQAFSDPATLHALEDNVIWSLAIVTVPTIIGLAAAVTLNGRGRVRAFAQGVLFLPSMLTVIVVGLVWDALYNPDLGFFDHVLQQLHITSSPVDWLGGSGAEWSLLVPGIWISVGLPLVLYLAGLQNIPPELYEAAVLDGARKWPMFRHITLPSLRNVTIVVVALATINSLQVFGLVYAMTGGGPGNSTQVLGTWMYFQTFEFGRVGFGAAVAWIVTTLGLLITIPYVLWGTRRD
jgi:raffinose/stachyose/melibiose transport system permease protein